MFALDVCASLCVRVHMHTKRARAHVRLHSPKGCLSLNSQGSEKRANYLLPGRTKGATGGGRFVFAWSVGPCVEVELCACVEAFALMLSSCDKVDCGV